VLDIASSNPFKPVGKECATPPGADAEAEGSCVDEARRACEADIDDIWAVIAVSTRSKCAEMGLVYVWWQTRLESHSRSSYMHDFLFPFSSLP
jgi:hypothetical protein